MIHNGIEPRPLPSARGSAARAAQLGLDDDAFVVATVARLDPVKDLMTLLEAFAIVRRRVPSAQLVIVGDGPERERLAARAAQTRPRGIGPHHRIPIGRPGAAAGGGRLRQQLDQRRRVDHDSRSDGGGHPGRRDRGGRHAGGPRRRRRRLLVPCRDPDRLAVGHRVAGARPPAARRAGGRRARRRLEDVVHDRPHGRRLRADRTAVW